MSIKFHEKNKKTVVEMPFMRYNKLNTKKEKYNCFLLCVYETAVKLADCGLPRKSLNFVFAFRTNYNNILSYRNPAGRTLLIVSITQTPPVFQKGANTHEPIL